MKKESWIIDEFINSFFVSVLFTKQELKTIWFPVKQTTLKLQIGPNIDN